MSISNTLPRQLACTSCSRALRNLTTGRPNPSSLLPTLLPTTPLSKTQQKRHNTTLSIPLRANPQPLSHPQTRTFHTTPPHPAVSTHRPAPASKKQLRDKDRGPPSKEDTQTDFRALDVLGGGANQPSTSVDVCTTDGFVLDSGLHVADGNGVVLTAGEAFVWRPWLAREGAGAKAKVVNGEDLRRGRTEGERTGGVLNAKGQWEVGEEAWGVLKALWPKPDLLIIGTGPSIRPLSPSTRVKLQELGMRIEVLDTRNAASQFNLLATERGVMEVAAALVPLGFGGGVVG